MKQQFQTLLNERGHSVSNGLSKVLVVERGWKCIPIQGGIETSCLQKSVQLVFEVGDPKYVCNLVISLEVEACSLSQVSRSLETHRPARMQSQEARCLASPCKIRKNRGVRYCGIDE